MASGWRSSRAYQLPSNARDSWQQALQYFCLAPLAPALAIATCQPSPCAPATHLPCLYMALPPTRMPREGPATHWGCPATHQNVLRMSCHPPECPARALPPTANALRMPFQNVLCAHENALRMPCHPPECRALSPGATFSLSPSSSRSGPFAAAACAAGEVSGERPDAPVPGPASLAAARQGASCCNCAPLAAACEGAFCCDCAPLAAEEGGASCCERAVSSLLSSCSTSLSSTTSTCVTVTRSIRQQCDRRISKCDSSIKEWNRADQEHRTV